MACCRQRALIGPSSHLLRALLGLQKADSAPFFHPRRRSLLEEFATFNFDRVGLSVCAGGSRRSVERKVFFLEGILGSGNRHRKRKRYARRLHGALQVPGLALRQRRHRLLPVNEADTRPQQDGNTFENHSLRYDAFCKVWEFHQRSTIRDAPPSCSVRPRFASRGLLKELGLAATICEDGLTRLSEFQRDITKLSKMSGLTRRACYKCGNVGHYAGASRAVVMGCDNELTLVLEVCSSSERLCYNCKQPGMRHGSWNKQIPYC